MANIREFNNFRSGQLPKAQTIVRQTESYSTGCEVLESAMINPAGYIEAKPGFSVSKPVEYPVTNFLGKRYVLNTEVADFGPVTALPAGSENFASATINDGDAILRTFIDSGKHLAMPEIDDTFIGNDWGTMSRFLAGHPQKVDTAHVAGNRLFESGKIYQFSTDFKFYRAFKKRNVNTNYESSGIGSALTVNGLYLETKSPFKLEGSSTYTFVDEWGMQVNVNQTLKSSGDGNGLALQFGWKERVERLKRIALYVGVLDKSKKDTFNYQLRESTLKCSASITIQEYTIKSGTYQFNEDVWMVGLSDMFQEFQLTTSIKSRVDDSSFDKEVDAGGKTSITNGKFILGWGNIATPSKAEYESKTDISVTPVAVTNTAFRFTGRTISIGARRIGFALYKGQSGIAATGLYYGGGGSPVSPSTTDSTTTGRAIPTANFDAADPYHVGFESDPIWMERTSRGIIVGTEDGEFVLSNEQIAPPTIQRISSIGTSAKMNLFTSTSCELDGRVYFASKYGLSSIQFSNEVQSYIPQHIYTENYGGSVVGVARVPGERAIMILLSDNSLWRVFAETGGLSYVGNYDGAIGLTPSGDIYVDLGDGTKTMMGQGATGGTCIIETTKFGNYPSGTTNLKKMFVSFVDSIPTEECVYSVDGLSDQRIFDDGEVAQYAIDGVKLTGTRELFTGGITNIDNGGIGVRLVIPEGVKLIGVFADITVSGV